MNEQFKSAASNKQAHSETFQVVLKGVHANTVRSESVEKLAALFKATTVQVETLLNTPSYTLKKGLSLEAASHYKKAIDVAGGSCELIAENTGTALDFAFPKAAPTATSPETIESHEQAAMAPPAVTSSPVVPVESAIHIASSKVPPPVDVQDVPTEGMWWYVKGGQQIGPVTKVELRTSIAAGIVSPSDRAWCEGMPAWQPLALIEEFAKAITTNSTKPPPVDFGPSIAPLEAVNAMKLLVESLQVLQHKISRNNAYLGVVIGFSTFGFSLFLSWASIPTGMMAKDGGAVSGWSELAFLAVIPLLFALYPVFLQQSVQLKTLLINVVLAFGLLGYNNVVNRESWHNGYGNMGSILSVGFWIGLMAMVVISACGVAWSMHTSGEQLKPKEQ